LWLFSHDYIQLLGLGVCKSHLNKALSFLNLFRLVLSPNLNIHLCWQCLHHITRFHQDSLFQLLGYFMRLGLNFRIALAMTSGLAFAKMWKSGVRFGQFTNKNICSTRFINRLTVFGYYYDLITTRIDYFWFDKAFLHSIWMLT